MNEEAWPAPSGGPPREPLPRVEDLPIAEQGYEQESVRAAFDSFYRHAAQLDAALRTLEAVDSFHRQAAALRADLRTLRTAGWTQQPWTATPAYGYARRVPREGVSPTVWRIAGEAAFLIAVAVALGVAKLAWWLIVLVMAGAWGIVLLIEWTASRDRWLGATGVSSREHPIVEASPPDSPTDEDARGWSAFEEAQEPSDAMTMIGAPPAEGADAPPAADEPSADEGDAPSQRSPEQAPDTEPPRHRWWRRARDEADEPVAPSVAGLPHHVRVLPADEGREGSVLDPWEQGFDADGDRSEPGVGEPVLETEADEPPRRRIRRR